MLQVDVLYPIEGGYTKVSAKLVNLGLALRGLQRVRQDSIPPHVTLGCNDTREVVVPVAENPHDFFVHLVSVLLAYTGRNVLRVGSKIVKVTFVD